MASDTPTVFFRDDVLCVAAWRDVFFEIWLEEGTGRHFRTLRQHLMDSARAQPDQKIAVFSIVKILSLANVDKEVREEAAARAREVRPHNKGSVLVLESKGFAGSLIRGIVAGLALVDRSAAPMKSFETVALAANWLAPRLAPVAGRPIAAHDIVAACERVLAAGAVGVLKA